MGGFIVQTLAYRYPERIRSLIISNSVPYPASTYHVFLKAQLELLKTQAPVATLTQASCAWVFSAQFLSKPSIIKWMRQIAEENPYPFTVEGFEGQLAALEQFDARSWNNPLRLPALVFAANEDLIFNQTLVKRFAEGIQAEFYCFTECGHLPHLEYPQVFTQRVKEFIRNHD